MSYLGSKGQSGVFQNIIGNMPPHSVYVEPFFGTGKIFFTKRPAVRNVLIDADRCALRKSASNPALTEANVICGDALAILPTLTLPDKALVYCDPP